MSGYRETSTGKKKNVSVGEKWKEQKSRNQHFKNYRRKIAFLSDAHKTNAVLGGRLTL